MVWESVLHGLNEPLWIIMNVSLYSVYREQWFNEIQPEFHKKLLYFSNITHFHNNVKLGLSVRIFSTDDYGNTLLSEHIFAELK